jgi:hypothetical protein
MIVRIEEKKRKQDIISHVIQSKASVKISQDLLIKSLNKIHLSDTAITATQEVMPSTTF